MMSSEAYKIGEFKNEAGEKFRTVTYEGHSSPNVLFFIHHGLGEHGGRYESVAAALAELPVRVFSYDLRGHGESVGKKGDADGLEAFARDLGPMLTHAKAETGLDRVVLMGHSMGAAAVLQYVTHEVPDTGIEALVLSAPPLQVPTDLAARLKLAVGKVLVKVAPTMVMPSGLDPNGISTSAEEVARYKNDPLVHDLISTRLGLEIVASGPRLLQLSGRVKLPTLLYHGTDDPICAVGGSRQLKEGIGTDDLTYVELAGLRHETHHEVEKGRAELFAAMTKWLAPRVEARASESESAVA